LRTLREERVDLLLLDFFMPGMTGEEVVVELRKFNTHVQVVLQTGYASEQPPRELLQRLDIQGYHDKSEGPDKLLMWTDIGLKAAYTVQLLSKSREGLRYILNATPALHRIQPLDSLLQGIMLQVAGLMGSIHSFLAVMPPIALHPGAAAEQNAEGFLAMVEDDTELAIKASTGRFTGCKTASECLVPEEHDLVCNTLNQRGIKIVNSCTIVPLYVNETILGVLYLDRPASSPDNIELLQIFANQSAVAIQNSRLYEMAAIDSQTGVYLRTFFEQSALRELRSAFRLRKPLALIMTDMDGLKTINDTAGHLAGDRAIAMLGKAIQKTIRDTDVAGRFGGDEFCILLGQTDNDGAVRAAERLLQALEGQSVPSPQGELMVKASLGLAVLQAHELEPQSVSRSLPREYFWEMLQELIRRSDDALYSAKKAGGNQVCSAPDVHWSPAPSTAR
jgi:diguanylate cyclase (GGDEF)-like protein